MAAAPFEKQGPDVAKNAPQNAPEKRVRKLTFWQKTVLVAGITVLGGIPSALLTMGSVRAPPPQTHLSGRAEVMSNATPVQIEACRVPSSKDDFKPTMNLQNR